MTTGRLWADPAAAADRARRVGDLLDSAFEIPVVGYRVGIDPLVGILPVAGDGVMGLCSLYVVFEGFRAGTPVWLVLVMLLLVGLDVAVGSIPVVGPVFDAVLKVNQWNVRLLERSVPEAPET